MFRFVTCLRWFAGDAAGFARQSRPLGCLCVTVFVRCPTEDVEWDFEVRRQW